MRGHPQRKSELITLYHRYLYIEKNAVWTQLGTTCSLRNPLGGPDNQPCGLEDFILHCYKIREMLWEIFDSAETGNFQECKESVHFLSCKGWTMLGTSAHFLTVAFIEGISTSLNSASEGRRWKAYAPVHISSWPGVDGGHVLELWRNFSLCHLAKS